MRPSAHKSRRQQKQQRQRHTHPCLSPALPAHIPSPLSCSAERNILVEKTTPSCSYFAESDMLRGLVVQRLLGELKVSKSSLSLAETRGIPALVVSQVYGASRPAGVNGKTIKALVLRSPITTPTQPTTTICLFPRTFSPLLHVPASVALPKVRGY